MGATISDPAKALAVRQRRARAGIPDQVRHREKWRLALDMLDQMTDQWGLPARPVTTDSGYGDAAGFREGLQERGHTYVVAVNPTTSAYPETATPALVPSSGRGRPPKPKYRDKPSNLRDLALATDPAERVPVTSRHGTRKSRHNPPPR